MACPDRVPQLPAHLSQCRRQDHNGFSHQDPGFVDHVLNKSPEVVLVYLPPDANTLLSVADHVLRSRDYVNVVVAEAALLRLALHGPGPRPLRPWGRDLEWAGSVNGDREPDVVLACAGDVPTQEILAASDLLRRHLPELAVRVVNVVDMTRLLPRDEHPHGMADFEYDGLFTTDKPVIGYDGYPWLVHRLAYRRTGHANLHVRGYKEMGTTTTPFQMAAVRNDLDRYRLVMDEDRPCPRPRRPRRRRPPADGRRPHPPPRLDPRARHRPARGRRLDLDRLTPHPTRAKSPHPAKEFIAMTVRVGINGFGRIGRTYLRAALDRAEAGTQDVEVVAVNDIAPPATLAHLLEYDSTFGHIGREVDHDDSWITVDGRRIAVSAERDPAVLHWSDYGAGIVVESTSRSATATPPPCTSRAAPTPCCSRPRARTRTPPS